MRMRLLTALLAIAATKPLVADDKPDMPKDSGRVEQLIRELGAASFEQRERAVKDLIVLGDNAVPQLIAATKNSDLEIARRAEHCLRSIVGTNEKVEPLIAQLKSPHPRVRAAAADKVGGMGEFARPALPALILAIDDPDKHVCSRAIVALGHMGPTAAAAVPTLTRLLGEPHADVEVRWAAAVYLGYIGKPAESAVPELLRLLEHKDHRLRSGAITALASLGGSHKDVVPALIRALEANSGNVQGAAAWTLGKICKDPGRCIPALVNALNKARPQEERMDARPGLIAGLASFGPAAKPAIPALVQIAKNQEERLDIRSRAILTLGAIGPDAKAALRSLQNAGDSTGLVHPFISRALEGVQED